MDERTQRLLKARSDLTRSGSRSEGNQNILITKLELLYKKIFLFSFDLYIPLLIYKIR